MMYFVNTQTLVIVAKARGLNASDLARAAGVSRAAVSLWMKRPEVDLKDRHLERVARHLKISMESLMRPLPALHDRAAVRQAEASLLWDRLFPSLGEFAIALAKRELRAIARLVEVYGMFQGEKIVGEEVWKRWAEYSPFLHPARREGLAKLCKELRNLRLI
jgi:transcriptional regulator with XRE-family HTH domain